MAEILPFTSDSSQSFTVPLGANKFLIEARWNEVAGFWTFDITAEPSQVLLVSGIPILIGQDLLAPYALGIGSLVATDTGNGGVDAGPDDLGDRVTVTWLSPDAMALIPGPEPLPYVPPAVITTPTVVVPPFTPLSLGSTLKLWLRGDAGITQSGGNVTAWADQSGNANNVVNFGTVPFSASAINGNPGITCSASAGMQNTTTSPLPAGSARTVFIVAKGSSEVGGGLFCNRLSSHTQEVWLMGASGSQPGLVYASDGVVVAAYYKIPPPTVGNPLILEVTSTGGAGATPTVTLNGALKTATQSGPSTSVETGSIGFAIGIHPYSPAFGWIGDICEVIVCDTILSAGDELSVKTYLAARYGIAVV